MKLVIPGGTGHLGKLLVASFGQQGDEIVVLTRTPRSEGCAGARVVAWDGRTIGPWADEIDGADAVINLAGRTVNCRYTRANLKQMMDSRVDSTRVIGTAIERSSHPPAVWLQMSTAAIYAHRFDAPNDENTGQVGGEEPDAPTRWRPSIEIAKAWEETQCEAIAPETRKVALRSAIVMSPEAGGPFDILLHLTRWGLGGAIAGGRQFVSWIHDRDFARAVEFLLERKEVHGPVNLAAPHPLPQGDFMAALRAASGARFGLPAAKWMAEIGAFFLGTETELVLKSRYVVPGRLLDAGFAFHFYEWPAAARDLVARSSGANAK